MVEQPRSIPHSRPQVSDRAIESVVSVLRSGQLAYGAVSRELEQLWCDVTGTAAAAVVSSGVSALRLALMSLGVEPGGEVVVPAYSCVALPNAVLSLRAEPVFADVLCDDWTLDVDDVAQHRLTSRTSAIVAVNLFGQPAQMKELNQLDVPVVEDCAHGIGGITTAGPFGGGSIASISSFYATKMIGAGEGGIVASRDEHIIEQIRAARDYGDQAPDGLRLNDKMTEVEAALALDQMERLPQILAERASLASRYAEALSEVAGSKVVLPPAAAGRIWYRYAVRLLSGDAGAVCTRMAERGVRVEQPVWDLRDTLRWRDDCPVTSEAFDRVVSLPLYPGLTSGEQDRVVEVFLGVLGGG